MDFLKKAKDRVGQTVSEQLGSATKTEYDESFQNLMHRADEIKMQTEKMIMAFEPYFQPDAAARLLPGLIVGDTKNQPELIALQMGQYAESVGQWKGTDQTQFQSVLKAAQDTFQIIGQADRDYLSQVSANFLAPVKHFLNTDIKTMEHEKKKLSTKRLDMDSTKNKVAKNPAAAPEAERALQAFNEQQERVKQEVTKAEAKLYDVMQALKKYVEAHIKYLQTAEAALSELHTKL